ncbi:MAG: hypothetical protein QG597_2448 [Actinomycetota bacterium]|nr:hypothetical protein [Actinomycetota bacterium]
MTPVLDYAKITDARRQLKDVYDTASANISVVIRRDFDEPVALLPKDSILRALRALVPLDPEVRFDEDGHVYVWLPGLPISADDADFDGAIGSLVAALRDYADEWVDDLRHFRNHEANWGLVNLVLLSSDDELVAHLVG